MSWVECVNLSSLTPWLDLRGANMKRLVCFAVLILTLSRNTQAVIKAGDQTLTGGGGVMAPTSNVDLTNAGGGTTKVGSVGGAAYGQYLYYVTPNLGLGADINFAASGDETSTSVIPRGITTNSFKSTLVLLMARANLSNTGPTVPYVFAGVGFHSTTLDMKTMPQPGFAWVDTGTTE